jgi:hypothetical protein
LEVEMTRLGERLSRAAEMVSPPEPALDRLRRRRERRDRNRRIGSAAVALAVAAGGVGGLLYAFGNLGRRAAPADSPGGFQASGPAPPVEAAVPLAPGQYFYEKSIRVLPDDPGVFEGGRVTEETWWGPDDSGRRVAHSTTPSYGVGATGTWGQGEFPAENLSGLSTDPEVLAQQLRERSAPGGASPQPAVTPGPGQSAESGGLWRAVTALLEMPNAEPALRWALFQVAAGIPGVEVLEDVEDPVGRDAVGLRIFAEDAEKLLFFDLDSGQLMASTEDYGGGQIWYRIVVRAGVVGSTDETPSEGQAFFPDPVNPLP